ncbi:HpcH/HpaI aldolase/citrate lyase family protein [Jannaschia seohaensis]|uniref:(3S)-malyl-CoA thioesterase n=1 Tax=Jannaschia seohaensis TaxID=475081 RepID=A0A2Y9A1P4_9RHOB|nr:CoA ester lyase [Jannaschia seohaensis]PWJ22082.1 (3S)-malyl-CoA thioesterase [Jannaschia seohaensis]SSA38360.1 (3S)-malyl-CoA thioesterase [Jannaschia seohaensis]
MSATARPTRSVLYIPASKPRALEKACGLAVDAIIFDLEDAVAPAEKPAARETLARALTEFDYGPRLRIVRVNGAETEWGGDDLAAVAAMPADAVLLPKVGGSEDVAAVAAELENAGADLAIWAMMESPDGILNAATIARAPRMGGFVLGTNDLAKDLGTRPRADRLPLMLSLQTALLAARAAGIPCIDGVYNAFRDEEGLRAECEQGRDLGMDGKTLIHPAQIEIANAAFGPTEAEIEEAGRIIAAFDDAMAQGQGVAVLDGKIVENLHVETARRTLAKQAAIAELGG